MRRIRWSSPPRPDFDWRARRILLAALAREPFVAREQGSLTRDVMDRTLRRARIRPTIAIEVASNETIKQAVAAGFGVAFLSAHATALDAESERLAVLDILEMPAQRRWFTVHRRGKRLSAEEGAERIRRRLPPRLQHYWRE